MGDILVMEQGRQVWSGYSYADRLHSATHVHNKPLVPRRLVRGVSERTILRMWEKGRLYLHHAIGGNSRSLPM